MCSVCVCASTLSFVRLHDLIGATFSLHLAQQQHSDTEDMCRVGQNRTSAPYIAVCMVISLLEIPYVHRLVL